MSPLMSLNYSRSSQQHYTCHILRRHCLHCHVEGRGQPILTGTGRSVGCFSKNAHPQGFLPLSLGWSDIALLAISENVYYMLLIFMNPIPKKPAYLAGRAHVARPAKFSFKKNHSDLKIIFSSSENLHKPSYYFKEQSPKLKYENLKNILIFWGVLNVQICFWPSQRKQIIVLRSLHF